MWCYLVFMWCLCEINWVDCWGYWDDYMSSGRSGMLYMYYIYCVMQRGYVSWESVIWGWECYIYGRDSVIILGYMRLYMDWIMFYMGNMRDIGGIWGYGVSVWFYCVILLCVLRWSRQCSEEGARTSKKCK